MQREDAEFCKRNTETDVEKMWMEKSVHKSTRRSTRARLSRTAGIGKEDHRSQDTVCSSEPGDSDVHHILQATTRQLTAGESASQQELRRLQHVTHAIPFPGSQKKNTDH